MYFLAGSVLWTSIIENLGVIRQVVHLLHLRRPLQPGLSRVPLLGGAGAALDRAGVGDRRHLALRALPRGSCREGARSSRRPARGSLRSTSTWSSTPSPSRTTCGSGSTFGLHPRRANLQLCRLVLLDLLLRPALQLHDPPEQARRHPREGGGHLPQGQLYAERQAARFAFRLVVTILVVAILFTIIAERSSRSRKPEGWPRWP